MGQKKGQFRGSGLGRSLRLPDCQSLSGVQGLQTSAEVKGAEPLASLLLIIANFSFWSRD